MLWLAIGIAIVGVGAAFYFAPKGWRTVATNAVIAVLAPVAEVLPEIQAALPDDWAVYALVATNLMNLVLRKITTTPMGKKT